jgi:hypothetical protein
MMRSCERSGLYLPQLFREVHEETKKRLVIDQAPFSVFMTTRVWNCHSLLDREVMDLGFLIVVSLNFSSCPWPATWGDQKLLSNVQIIGIF